MGQIRPFIFRADKEVAEAVWDIVVPGIQHAQEKFSSPDAVDYYFDCVMKGLLDLWICKKVVVNDDGSTERSGEGPFDMVFLTTITRDPHPTLEIFYWGGNEFDFYVDEARRVLNEVACRNGCRRIKAICRKGWIKAIAKHKMPGDTFIDAVIMTIPVLPTIGATDDECF